MRIRVLLATAAVVAFAAVPASAHTELVSTNPVDGSSITSDTAPPAITLTFSEAPLAEGTAIVITDSAGAQLPAGQVTINGSDVTTPWPQGLASGKTTVAWRAASDDGHVVSGTFSFTFESLAEVTTIATPMPVTAATATATTSRGLTGGAAVAITVMIISAGGVALLAKRR